MDLISILDVMKEETIDLDSYDEDYKNFLYDKVLMYQPLLSSILQFVVVLDGPKSLLSLRLVSPHFNEAVLYHQGTHKKEDDQSPISLCLSKDMTEGSLASLDGRLTRNVVLDFAKGTCACVGGTCDCLSTVFSSLSHYHGSHIRTLKLDHVLVRELGNLMTLINAQCPFTKALGLRMEKVNGDQEEGSVVEWEGKFAHHQTHLESLEVHSSYERSSPIGRYVIKVLTSFLEQAPNLCYLTIRGNMSWVIIDTGKMKNLKYLKHKNLKSDTVDSSRGLVAMINSVSSTLEELELSHRHGTGRGGLLRQDQLQALQQPLLCLKTVTFSVLNGGGLAPAICRHILESATEALETVNVRQTDWTPLLSELTEPLSVVKTLSIEGYPPHPCPLPERIGILHHAFPNLNRLRIPIPIPSGRGNRVRHPSRLIVDVLQTLGRWDAPFKDIQLTLEWDCSIHDVAEAFEAMGEAFFTYGLESLSVAKTGWALEDSVRNQEQNQRLKKIFLWTREMKQLVFHGFKIFYLDAEGLASFVSKNKLPVAFSANRAIPKFEQ